jgi:hypothetical protein
VIFVKLLPILDAPQDGFGGVELRKSNQSLYNNHYEGHQAHNAMNAVESSLGMTGLIHLDNDQACDESQCAGEIECEVYMSSLRFLFRCHRWLEHQNSLCNKQNAGRVDKLRKYQYRRRKLAGVGLTGWYEKKMTWFMNTLDQTRAASFKIDDQQEN